MNKLQLENLESNLTKMVQNKPHKDVNDQMTQLYKKGIIDKTQAFMVYQMTNGQKAPKFLYTFVQITSFFLFMHLLLSARLGKRGMPTLLIGLVAVLLYKLTQHLLLYSYGCFAFIGHFFASMFILRTCNLVFCYFKRNSNLYELAPLPEFRYINRTFGGLLYCLAICYIQYRAT